MYVGSDLNTVSSWYGQQKGKYQINALVGSACFLLWHIQANDSKNGWC